MSSDEFSIIDRYFTGLGQSDFAVELSTGDDAAVVDIPPGRQLVLSMDTLNLDVHFLTGVSPEDLACKALAVNLSDLAAMAADPAWFLLSLSLPKSDPDWLYRFSSALGEMAERYRLALIGGDTCRGPLSVTIQIAGLVPSQGYVRRSQAKPGDLILVSGELGNAALGLAQLQARVDLPGDIREACINALHRPRPRIEMVPFLREYANAAIDISDGLQADLGHILKASGVGAILNREALPVNRWIKQEDAYHYALRGGDDYEICCTVAAEHRQAVDSWNTAQPDCRLSIIGEITDSAYLLQHGESSIDLTQGRGFQHFD